MAGAGGNEVGRISVRVVPNLDKFYADLKAKLEAAERGLEGQIKVTADFDAAGLREKINAATSKDAKVKVQLDTSNLDAAKLIAERLAAAKDVKVGVDLDDRGVGTRFTALLARLKAQAAAARIKVNVGVDGNGLKRGLSSALGGLFGGGAKAAGGAAGGGVGIFGSFLDTAALVAAVAAIIAPALALLSGAIAALPALLSGIIVPIGAVALGFKGIAQAAEAAGLLSEGKKGKVGIGPALQSLRDTLSQKFQDGFTPIFQKLAPLIPALGQGMLPVADGVIKIAQAFTQMITSTQSLGLIQAIFDNIGKALTVAAPGVASFSEGILKLISGGSKSLPGFANLFNRMGNAVDDWVTKVSTPDFWGTSKLDRGLSNLQTILGKLGGLFGDIFSKSFDMLADPKFADKMGTFVDDTKKFVDEIMPALKGLFEDVATIFNTIVGVMDKVNNWKPPDWLKQAIDGTAGILGADTGGDQPKPKPKSLKQQLNLPELASSLEFLNIPMLLAGSLRDGSGVQTMVAAINTFLGQAFSGAFTFLSTTLPNMLLTAIQPALDGLKTLGTGIWDGLTQSAQLAWQGVVTVVQTVISQIQGIVSNIGGAISGVWDGIVAEAQSAWGKIVSAVNDAIGKVTAAVGALPGKITGFFEGLAGKMTAIGGQIMDGLKNGIISAGQRAIDAAKDIAGKVAGAIAGVLGIHSPSKVTHGFGVNMMEGFQNGLDEGAGSVLDKAKALAQKISEAIAAGTNPAVFKDQVKSINDQLNIQRDQLKVQLDQTPKEDKAGRDSLKDQLAQIKAVKDQLGLQGDQAKLVTDQADGQSKITEQLGQQFSKMVDIGKNFAMANVKQFESDIGISGNGAIPQLAETGIGWLTSTLGHLASGALGGTTVFNVNSMDDALAADRNRRNKDALQYTGR
jgi:phage-related protein